MNTKNINNFIINNQLSIKIALYILLYIPLVFLIYNMFTDNLGANPIEKVTHETGTWGLKILLITLTISPLIKILNLPTLARFRRLVGVTAFVYIFLHFFVWFGLDHWFDFQALYKDVIKKPYILAGFIGLVILIVLALTSFNKIIKLLGGSLWKKIHSLVYLASLLGVLHYFLSKVSKHNTAIPEIYIYILLILLGYRLFYYIKNKYFK